MYKILRCDPKLFEKNLSGRSYIVTGANSGAGFATSAQLARQGAHVIGACRRVDAGKQAFAELGNVPGSFEVMELDLGSLASVRRFTAAFFTRYDRLDGLVNNAGVMACPEGRTEDCFETQFGVNHLGHFVLTERLLDTLKSSAPSRIVCVSSMAHVGTRKQVGEIYFDDLNFEKRSYNRVLAYAQSKLANVLHALDLSRRLKDTGVSAFSVHPGWVRSNLAQHLMPVWVQNIVMKPFSGLLGMMSWEDGAQTTLHCLLDDDVPKHSGEYFSQISILYPDKTNRPGGWPMRSPNPSANDLELAEELYHRSLELVGLGIKGKGRSGDSAREEGGSHNKKQEYMNMETTDRIELTDESVYPDDAVLKSVLGKSYNAFCELLKLYDENEMVHEWRYYNDGKAWLCKVQKKKRTIVWMSAWKGYLKATIYFPERYLDEIYSLDISNEVKERIRKTKNVGKSKPCTFEIRNAKVLTDFNKVMQFKITAK